MVDIFDPGCELLPPWTKEIYLCTAAPLQYLLSDLLPPPPSSKKRTYKIISPPQTKMTTKDDIKGLVSLKFLRPWATLETKKIPSQAPNGKVIPVSH